MAGMIDPRVRTFSPSLFGTGGDVGQLNALWSGIVRAAQLQMQQQQQLATPMGPLSGVMGAPLMSAGRMPQVVGASQNLLPASLLGGGTRGMGQFANGGVDFGSLLRRQLLSAVANNTMPSAGFPSDNIPGTPMTPPPAITPPPTGFNPPASSDTPPPYMPPYTPPYTPPYMPPTVCPPPPSTPSDCPPVTSDCPPTDSSDSSKKVFVLGNLKKFGGGTIRKGLEELLRGQTQKDRKGERTHSKLSPEDTAKVKALLESNDPEVKKVLNSKVPDKKSIVLSEDGKILDTLNTTDVVANNSLGVGVHADHMRDKGRNFDRSAGGQINAGGTTHQVAGTELHSPIKISLDGKDAKLNSTNGFAIDLNGFDEKGGQTTTSGGLNSNEAWLVRDRAGDGIKKNGVVDGDDVYGDHNGTRKDGYDDLARDFASELKTDPKTGKRYLDLSDPNSRAGKELQLLDAQGNLRPAKDVLKRIDVDGTAVDERDGKGNVITARSSVTYVDGRTATSADQWYSTPAPTRG